MTDIAEVVELTDPGGAIWNALDISHTWDGKRRGAKHSGSYRHVSRSIRAATCDAANIKSVSNSFAEAPLDHFNHGPHDYRGYLGEYPCRWSYMHRSSDPITFEDNDSGVAFQHLTLRQLRGSEWERDYSQIGESKTLLMPAPELVEAGKLRWDHCGGWLDPDGQIQVQDPWWWSSEKPSALICRTDYLDRYLRENSQALIILGFQLKIIAGSMGEGGRVTERKLFIRHRGKTKLIHQHVVRD